MKKYASPDDYFEQQVSWNDELNLLRSIVGSSGLKETLKWSMPTYVYNEKNIAGIGAFKSYVGIWFFQGALMSDPNNKLVNAQEGKTQAMRQWRFKNLSDIESNRTLILEYIAEAIANQAAGREIRPTKKPLTIPDELKKELEKNADLRSKFEALNLTHKRDFSEHIASAKRPATKQARLEKIIPMILDGVGLNDKYK
ncbi:MAG: YdeI/OmpD-associated family protein [Cyclobacteriaceae bacterium]